MMAVILNSAMLDSDTLFSSLRFTQKHSHSTLTLTQTISIWLKLIHSHLSWWWQASWIPPSWILPSWIQPFCTKLWVKLIQFDSNSFILTQLDDGSHLEFCHLEFGHLGFSHLSFSSQTHSHLPRLVPTICTNKKTFTYSFWLNLMMAAILNSTMLDSAILVFPLKLTHTCKDWFPPFAQKKLHSHFTPCHLHKKPSLIHSDSTWWWQPSWILPCWIKKLHSFILTQLDDGSHLEFCHVGFRHLVFFSQIHSKTLSLHSDSDSN